MRRSIRFKITAVFIGLMAAMLFSVWFINSWWLEYYYAQQKMTAMEDAYNRLDAVVMEKIQSGESIGEVIAKEAEQEWIMWSEVLGNRGNEDSEASAEKKKGGKEQQAVDEDSLLYAIRDYGEKNNIAIVLVDSLTGKALLSSAREGDFLAQKVQRYILGHGNEKRETVKEYENYYMEKNYDPRSRSSYLESWGFFSDNSTMFIMSMPIASIRESVLLSNRFTMYVGIVILTLGSVLMYFVTRKITSPIMNLAALSARMSDLDFAASYKGAGQDEVGVLGRSMNTLSLKLKETIGELQNANIQLQQDIEEKIQVDEMRKEFIANVSHELKTPIALIQGYAEGLTEGMCEDEESRSYYCEVITDEAAKMNKMVKQLLTLTALEFGNDVPTKECFDITELIRDWLNSAHILIQQNNAQIEYHTQGPIYVNADEFKIEEVITNYMNNAMNHLEGERLIRIGVEQQGDEVQVSVFNTGETIPEEDIPNLWTKFFKVDKARTRTYGGSGIGLSIVKAIVDTHGGRCGVCNRENGVEFWFSLEKGKNDEDCMELQSAKGHKLI